MTNIKGKFIVFEGIDGSGISTQTGRLRSYLESQYNIKTILAKEPSEGPVGTLIRQVLSGRMQGIDDSSLALLFAADRIDHNKNKILPVLEQGDFVICDRYLWSSYAYQGRKNDLNWLQEINMYASKPDLTVFIRVRPEISIRRITGSRFQTEIFEKIDILQQVYDNYVCLFAKWKESGLSVTEIDGERDADTVEMEIRTAIEKHFIK
ncbi:MAG: Thymidylate kinase [Candidatus Dichloromethanomonas elyunquensis]|nr:MAG: Thymidylate kinase [Candidatus Dichloromethanomonas elyunquensis]